MATAEVPRPMLYDLLDVNVVLRHLSPYLEFRSLVSLALTSRYLRGVTLANPEVFHRVDLSFYKSIPAQEKASRQKANTQQDGHDQESIPYLGDAFRYLSQHDLTHNVRTLILDRSSVTFTNICDLLISDRSSIRILSLRQIIIDDHMFTKLLRYLLRSSRPSDSLKLKGLYYFVDPDILVHKNKVDFPSDGSEQAPAGVTNSIGAQLGALTLNQSDSRERGGRIYRDPWYGAAGEIITQDKDSNWADLVEFCEGTLAFDAVVCRHDRQKYGDPRPRLATIALEGCHDCGSCPEGPARPGASPEHHLPMISPTPLHSSTVRAAQSVVAPLGSPPPTFIARCRLCLKDRWCEMCNDWWCEDCYSPSPRAAEISSGSASQTMDLVVKPNIKVHNGLCVANCLVQELLSGGGEGGMWG